MYVPQTTQFNVYVQHTTFTTYKMYNIQHDLYTICTMFNFPGGEILPVYSTSDGNMVTLVKEHSALPASAYNVSSRHII